MYQKGGQSHKVRPTSRRFPIWTWISLDTRTEYFDKEKKLGGDASWPGLGKRDKHLPDALDGANPNTTQIRTQEIIVSERQSLRTRQRRFVIGAVWLPGVFRRGCKRGSTEHPIHLTSVHGWLNCGQTVDRMSRREKLSGPTVA